jgi:hypothetical protein
MKHLSIVVLNYNTRKVTLQTLQSIKNSDLKGLNIEVILVDNGSSDDSITHLKAYKKTSLPFQYKLIELQENLGFAAGNNVGIRQAQGKYILLLNSDVILRPDTLKKQFTFMEESPQFAVSTCKLLLSSGKLDPASHRSFPTPWASFTYFSKLSRIFPRSKTFNQYHQGWKDFDKTHTVDVISGAFFFARREVFDKVGLFDEGFFMYAEDIDLCLRIQEAGIAIAYYPQAQAIHLKGSSGRNRKGSSDRKTITGSKSKPKSKSRSDYHFWKTMQLFYTKHYKHKYSKLTMWIIIKLINLIIKLKKLA